MNMTQYGAGEPAIDEQHAQELTDFLHTHLDQYGDAQEHIRACIEYASGRAGQGGLILTTRNEDGELVGGAVVCKTGMKGYIPEIILVYLAVRSDQRGKGLGGIFMKQIKELVEGDIALHVEADNPAKRLYEREGFTNPYLEMRWKRA